MESKKNICNSKVFDSLYHRYSKDLRRFLFYKVQDFDRAEDLLQEAFIKLWDNCKRVNYNKVKSYLFTTANNMFLNQVKHLKVVENYGKSNQKTATNESPEFLMIEQEFLEHLTKSIDRLPKIQREVFLLNRIDKKTYKEIAEQLGISVKAVEKRMHNALISLRKSIGNI